MTGGMTVDYADLILHRRFEARVTVYLDGELLSARHRAEKDGNPVEVDRINRLLEESPKRVIVVLCAIRGEDLWRLQQQWHVLGTDKAAEADQAMSELQRQDRINRDLVMAAFDRIEAPDGSVLDSGLMAKVYDGMLLSERLRLVRAASDLSNDPVDIPFSAPPSPTTSG